MKFYLSFDIGGTNIKYGVLNELGEVLQRGKVKTKLSGDTIINSIVAIKEKYAPLYAFEGVAFSVPGIVNIKTGYLKTGGAIKDFYEFDFKKILMEKLSLPVELDNDVNCVALAEKWQGNAQSSKNFLCMTIGTGIGGAIFLNGQLIRGHQYMAGEFGYMLTEDIFSSDDKHVTVSDKASLRDGLRLRYAKHRGDLTVDQVSGEDIYHLAEQGDILAKQTIAEFYQSLAMALYNLTFALNPEKILIGGAISERSEIFTAIKQNFQKILAFHNDLQTFSVEQLVTIENCKFNNDSGLIGAVYHFITMAKLNSEIE
ncbi:MAG: ROK family protein [Psychromonas sp.]